MPGFDGTGPRGRGPMTGGGRGFCAVPLSAPQQELDFLKNQSQALREQLEQIHISFPPALSFCDNIPLTMSYRGLRCHQLALIDREGDGQSSSQIQL